MCPVGCTKTDTFMYDIVRTPEAVDLAAIADFVIVGLWDFTERHTRTNLKITKSRNQQFPSYSVLRLFTGLAVAALMALKLMVMNAISNASMPAMPNTHQFTTILYSKF